MSGWCFSAPAAGGGPPTQTPTTPPPAVEAAAPRAPAAQQFLHVIVLEGRALVGADRQGSSDPYVTLSIDLPGTEPAQSTKLQRTVNPLWGAQGACLVTKTQAVLDNRVNSVAIKVYDDDVVGAPTLLGHVNVSIPSLASLSSGAVEKWHQLNSPGGNLALQYANFGCLRVAVVAAPSATLEARAVQELAAPYLFLTVLEARNLAVTPAGDSAPAPTHTIVAKGSSFGEGAEPSFTSRSALGPSPRWAEASPYSPFTVPLRSVDYVKLSLNDPVADNEALGETKVRLPFLEPGMSVEKWYPVGAGQNLALKGKALGEIKVRLACGLTDPAKVVDVLGAGYVQVAGAARARATFLGDEKQGVQANVGDLLYVVKYNNGTSVCDLEANLPSGTQPRDMLVQKHGESGAVPKFSVVQGDGGVAEGSDTIPMEHLPGGAGPEPEPEPRILRPTGHSASDRFQWLLTELVACKDELVVERARLEGAIDSDLTSLDRLRRRLDVVRVCAEWLGEEGFQDDLPDIFNYVDQFADKTTQIEKKIADEQEKLDQIMSVLLIAGGTRDGTQVGSAGSQLPLALQMADSESLLVTPNRGGAAAPSGQPSRFGVDRQPPQHSELREMRRPSQWLRLNHWVRTLRELPDRLLNPRNDKSEDWTAQSTALMLVAAGNGAALVKVSRMLLRRRGLPPMHLLALGGAAGSACFRNVVHAFGRKLGRRFGSLRQLEQMSRASRAAELVAQPMLAVPIGSLALRLGAWGTNGFMRRVSPLLLLMHGISDARREMDEPPPLLVAEEYGVMHFPKQVPDQREAIQSLAVTLLAMAAGLQMTSRDAAAWSAPAGALVKFSLQGAPPHLELVTESVANFALLLGLLRAEDATSRRRSRPTPLPIMAPSPVAVAPEYTEPEPQEEEDPAAAYDWYKTPVSFVRLVLGLPERNVNL